MTVSIPKPYERFINGVRETAAGVVSRLTNRVSTGVSSKGHNEPASSGEWSTVMTQRTSGAAVADSPVTAEAYSAEAYSTAAAARPAAADRPRPQRQISSAWVLTGMLVVVCVTAFGWLFAHGTAAAIWLAALVVVGFAGVPIGLAAMRLLGYEDPD